MAGPKASNRYTRVEREILRCAPLGIPADFTAWAGEGEKPVVQAEFLSRLWLGLVQGVRIHPFGLGLKGARVAGQINVSGARSDGEGRQSLVNFYAEACEFPDGFQLSRARLDAIVLDDCSVGSGSGEAIEMLSCEVASVVAALGCTIAGNLNLVNMISGDGVFINGSTISGKLVLNGAEIGGGLGINRTTIGDAGEVAVVAFDMIVAAKVTMTRSRFLGAVDFSHSRASNVVVTRSSFKGRGTPALLLAAMRIERNLLLQNSVFDGGISAGGIAVEGELGIYRAAITAAYNQWALDLIGCKVGLWIRVHMTRSRGGMSFEHADAKLIDLNRVAVDGVDEANVALRGTSARFDRIMLNQCRISSHAEFEACRAQGSVRLHSCLFAKGIQLTRMAAADVQIWRCAFGQNSLGWSVSIHSAAIEGILSVAASLLTSGFAAARISVTEIQIEGSNFGPTGQGPRPAHAFWMSEATVARRIDFSLFRNPTSPGIRNRVAGVIQVTNSTIAQDIQLCSMDATRIFAYRHGRSGRIVDVTGTRIGGSLLLTPYRDRHARHADNPDEPANFDGAITIDRARIDGDVILDGGTKVVAIGEIVRPTGSSRDEERVRKRKRGVALSAIGARIGGSMDLGDTVLQGIVDLRDAQICIIADRNGRDWNRIGVQPGHLLLDGLTYSDLDSGSDLDEIQRAERADEVTGRIAWLTMQYPGLEAAPATFVPQPYNQLASYFAQNGNERARRRVHIARRELQRRHAGLGWFERQIEWLLSATSEYGYNPGRAAFVTLGFLVIGIALAFAASAAGLAVPGDPGKPPTQPFNAVLYAIDVAVPFLDLGQDSGWSITPWPAGIGWCGDWLTSAVLAVYRMLGLILVSVTVLTFSGILREKE